MNTLALGRNEIMSNEGDGSAWTAIVGAGSGVLGILAGIFFKGLGYAANRGRSDGVLEARVASLDAALSASEARLNLRMAAMEAREIRIHDRLDETATKQDLRDLSADIKDMIRESRPSQKM